ncbi:hypothetical protein ACI65C_007114 [Semiaphis heraclei]
MNKLFQSEKSEIAILHSKMEEIYTDAVPTVFHAFPSYYQKASKVPRKEPFVRNPIQIKDSNFNTADISNPVENDIPTVVDKVGTCNEITLVDDKVGTSDEIVLTTNNKEVQTVNTYVIEIFIIL